MFGVLDSLVILQISSGGDLSLKLAGGGDNMQPQKFDDLSWEANTCRLFLDNDKVDDLFLLLFSNSHPRHSRSVQWAA
jgi:hypothetical protein